MLGNLHVRFGAGDEETCLGDEARRFIPTLPANPLPSSSQASPSAGIVGDAAFPFSPRIKDGSPAGRRPGRGFRAADGPTRRETPCSSVWVRAGERS